MAPINDHQALTLLLSCSFFQYYAQAWGRSWNEALALHPRSQEMDGAAIKGGSVQWVSKYGSVVASIMPHLENHYMGEYERARV
eukprot:CAMPEP_0201620008 /NCGR_PEP_ID=MMETSP0492-20130828/43017_1 /ASSEMBLY_ACC=CAM_ASM_000837 /TAXON_ID=420259 /ORGANISM="Thalassiosira gravida, Strain GMp14c1" /LENGTH=83 /DNA_ID=CAMNT_0048089059 /DNA_START=225 /DNA_END=477 /DNA_ORIENTATION=-